MKINFVQVQNFRKLKDCKIDLSDKETLLVGANNSGKTSATDALICFLDKSRKISVTDFTLSNWSVLNEYAASWLSTEPEELKGQDISDWLPYCPSLDVWLDAGIEDVHRVAHLIPTLKWKGEPLGVRLTYEPKDIDKLRENFLQDFRAIDDLPTGGKKLSFWPRDLKDYLKRKLSESFVIRAYILDPTKMSDTQNLSNGATPLEKDPFKGLFKVDIIEAQRGFSDPNSEQVSSTLSSQLQDYYARHLNPTDLPDDEDLPALRAIEEAQEEFDKKLDKSFRGALGEIKALGYPGFSDPDIKLSSRVNPIDGLDHDAAVIFDIQQQGFDNHTFSLPEQYNGLGYKNLIHIVFKLITFRDRWQRIGKAQKRRTEDDVAIEPIHLVLVEEPEAHLHAQVQQVFIREAYKILRKDINEKFTTQIVLSTHSSYIAHEAGFDKLRYFKRKPAMSNSKVPEAEVVDLSTVFGGDKKTGGEDQQILNTQKFVSRYLKTTHCDLFFANGIILVEGAAERMLLPHFIAHNYPELCSSYLSILEVGGAHAQRLKPLIDILALPTLVITDTDAKGLDGKKVQPQRNSGFKYGSDTLRGWFGLKDLELDDILDLSTDKKVIGNVRAAYQYGFKVKFHEGVEENEAIPYTFEDAIVLSNIGLFRGLTGSTGMVKKMHEATTEDSLEKCATALYQALNGEKAKMALDILYDIDPKKLKVPAYIDEGLRWLEKELNKSYKEFIFTDSEKAEEVEEV